MWPWPLSWIHLSRGAMLGVAETCVGRQVRGDAGFEEPGRGAAAAAGRGAADQV